jgi:peptidoglycan/xylan/chitin deacetylase (PgdA/CDA1 family)
VRDATVPEKSKGEIMSENSYPRDLVGYGRRPPEVRWPGDANIAVQFVLNYEEGGESCILDGDPASECLLSEIVGAQPWAGQRNLNMESIYEYGARAGFWRLWRMFTSRGVTLTVYGVTLAMARNPEAVAAMKEAAGRSPATACAGSNTRTFRKTSSASTSARSCDCTPN